MSIKIMSRIWESGGLKPTEKLILLSLADHANDDGVCYPSLARLVAKTGLSERGAQSTIKNLEERGWLQIERNAGPRGCNVFTVLTPELDAEPPQEVRPRRRCTPAGGAPNPRRRCTPTPAGGAPEPSFNHQEPVKSIPPPPPVAGTEREEILIAAGHDPTGLTATGRIVGSSAEMIEVQRWRNDLNLSQAEIVTIVQEVAAQKGYQPVSTLRYFTPAMQRFAGSKHAEKLNPTKQTQTRGKRHERQSANAALNELENQLSSGQAYVDTSDRDPFGGQ
ncbi:helix-turn-helix domain-containing protein [Pontivivens nitratireducens]|uniref:helix-turn-helix domain-containing protein n=1 Tax=Pontivivens nitratireducens TaxID=2758038 RepID=UPI001639F0E7|nr:helix-turn-helix domain-containing protein [Pontibrevibacter nitratireducens]